MFSRAPSLDVFGSFFPVWMLCIAAAVLLTSAARVVANFRETELKRMRPGNKADVYVMSQPGRKFEGVIDSAGFGVTPDTSLVGSLSQGLPDVQRSLNWVHLATRFPVRVRIDKPSADDFRIGASAIVVVRGDPVTTSR